MKLSILDAGPRRLEAEAGLDLDPLAAAAAPEAPARSQLLLLPGGPAEGGVTYKLHSYTLTHLHT